MEKAGFLSCGSACHVRDVSSGVLREGGLAVDEVKIVDCDLARPWVGARAGPPLELEVAVETEPWRRCRATACGGLVVEERSSFTGSVLLLEDTMLDGRRMDVDLCSPAVLDTGLLVLGLKGRGGGPMEPLLLLLRLAELKLRGLGRVVGLTGRRLGDSVPLSGCDKLDPSPVFPVGFRRERVREGKFDMADVCIWLL